MPIGKILVPQTGSPNDDKALSAGFVLSKGFGVHLDACFVRPDPNDAVPYLGTGNGWLDEIKDDIRQHAEKKGKRAAARARRHFTVACKKHGIQQVSHPERPHAASAGWSVRVGRAPHEIPEAAKFCDLTVFAGALAHYHRFIPNVLERTLLESGRPLLFAPGDSIGFPMERIAVAWDASAPAARGVFAAQPFLEKAAQIDVISVEELYEDPADPQRLVEYLAWQGFASRGHFIKKNSESVAQALSRVAEELEASLLVMGGYAHNRFEEAVFGGTTLHTIRSTQIPLLLMH